MLCRAMRRLGWSSRAACELGVDELKFKLRVSGGDSEHAWGRKEPGQSKSKATVYQFKCVTAHSRKCNVRYVRRPLCLLHLQRATADCEIFSSLFLLIPWRPWPCILLRRTPLYKYRLIGYHPSREHT